MYASDCIHIKDIRPGLKNINVQFIVLEVGNATLTKENREVRTFKVADQTACINVSIWGDPGNYLHPGDIVRMTKGYAVIWRSCLTLYSGKNGDIHKLGDFCMLFNEQLNMSEPNPNFGPQQGQAPTGGPQQQQQQQIMNGGNAMMNGTSNSRGGPPGIVAGGGGQGPSGGFNGGINSSNQAGPAKSRIANDGKAGGGGGGGVGPPQSKKPRNSRNAK